MLSPVLSPTTYFKPSQLDAEINCICCGEKILLKNAVVYTGHYTIQGEPPKVAAIFCSVEHLARFWPPLGRC